MDARRAELIRILRRRRARLMALVVATALGCGVGAAVVAPKVLIGGESREGADRGPAAPPADGAAAARESIVLRLSERVDLDPREAQSNIHRWAAMSESRRRQYFERYWRLAELSDDEREERLQQYAALRQLPKARQDLLRSRARQLQEFIDSRLGPQDRAVLNRLGPEERARRLLELWQGANGTR